MASHDALRVTLNQNQRRHYEVLFSGLERTLATLESAAARSTGSTGDAAATFSENVDDLPPAFAARAPALLEAIRERLRTLKSELSLAPRPVSQRQTCRALVNSEINRIEESYARSLRGYGEVDPSIAESLDPVLRALRESLGELASLLSPAREPTS